LIEYERFASLNAFGDYTDMMIKSMADKNEKCAPANTCVFFWYPAHLVCESSLILGLQAAS
jgi:hypothetical protein